MMDDPKYYEMRGAQERAVASSLAEGEARDRHLELADRYADRAWLIRNDHAGHGGRAAISGTDSNLSQAITRSRQLLAQSHRILAESRSGRPSRA